MEREEKLIRLQHIFKELGHAVIAYSGGVDSAFLLKVAYDTLGDKAYGVLAISPTYPSREYEQAKATAKHIGARLEIIETNEMADENFVNNPVNRCYFCKSELYGKIAEIAASGKYENLCDGSNLDDKGDHRPGMKAVEEKNVRSPLMEAQMTKDDIRYFSKQMGLPTWEKEALACLSSRFPYGETISFEKLKMVDSAENLLTSLGFRNVRARHQKNTIKIEVLPEDISRFFENEMRQHVVSELKKLGYNYVTIDLEGYRQGALNETLKVLETRQ